MGQSRKALVSFPESVKKTLGDELLFLQYGGMPSGAKVLKGIGAGVVQLSARSDTGAYRCVVALRLGVTLYVLHAFKKKSKQGVITPKSDIEHIKQNYKAAKLLSDHDG